MPWPHIQYTDICENEAFSKLFVFLSTHKHSTTSLKTDLNFFFLKFYFTFIYSGRVSLRANTQGHPDHTYTVTHSHLECPVQRQAYVRPVPLGSGAGFPSKKQGNTVRAQQWGCGGGRLWSDINEQFWENVWALCSLCGWCWQGQ